MKKDQVSALFFLAFSIAYGVVAQDIRLFPGSEHEPFHARTMPNALAIAGAVVSFAILINGFRTPGSPEGQTQTWHRSIMGLAWRPVFLLLITMAIYGFMLKRLGFIVSTTAFLLAGYYIMGERRWKVMVPSSVLVVIVFWFLLTQLLNIYLDPGVFGRLFE